MFGRSMGFFQCFLILLPIQAMSTASHPEASKRGIRSNRLKRVYGPEAAHHSSPWLGLLESPLYTCGAFLINLKDGTENSAFEGGSSDIALTAAHCYKYNHQYYQLPENMYISFGKHDRSAEIETNQINIKVVKAISHRHYHVASRNDDIAMLKLEKPVKFSKFVRPITLSNFTLAKLDRCFLSGWGGTDKLQIQNVDVHRLIDRDSLISVHDQFENALPIERGDSGSPLICVKGSHYVAQGIVSGNTNNDETFNFVNIVSKLDWISTTYDQIKSPMNYHPTLMQYNNVETLDKSMLERLLKHYITGVFGYVPESFYVRLNLTFDNDQYGKRWLEPEFYKRINVERDGFYIHGIVGYEIVHDASTCAVLCMEQNPGKICNYLVTTKQCFFSVKSNYQLNATAKMPYYQSLIIHTHSMDTTASTQVRSAPKIIYMGNKIPNLELSAPNWNLSISTHVSPMFHCIGQMWHRDRHNKIQHCRRVLDNSPTCLTMLVPEYKGHLQATFIDLNSRKTAISSFYYIRPLNSRWNSCPDSQLNYTVDKLPVFQSYNPLSGSFLAEPNTMPWMISLTEGYAIVLNESEINGIGRKDRTRFVLTTCNQLKNMKRPIIATVGSYFKDLVGYFQQSHLVQHSYSQPACSDMLASDSQPTIEEDKLYDFHRLLIDEDGLAVLELTNDIVFNDYIQPLSLAKYDIAELQTKPLFTVIYDAAWQHKPQAIIPLHIQSIVPPMNGDRWMMTRRSFQRVNGKDENLNTPLITCDKVAKKCELLGWHKNDGYYFTFGSHLDWMGQCLREAIKSDW